MKESVIEEKLQAISDLHIRFQNKNYQLSTLDVNATINLVEQLYAELIRTNTSVKKQNRFLTKETEVSEIKPTLNSSIEQEEFNEEINEVFNPPSAPEEQKIILSKANKEFQLGINEKIMFAKELYDDDVNSLNETINQLKSFENSELAYTFFDQKLGPFLIDEGKDEEIIQDFRSIILRIYG